jgi:hypothetical protein
MSKQKSPPFVMIQRTVLDSPAWRAMSHGARSLYLALRRRYNNDFHNNGKIYLSVRIASKEIGASKNSVAVWYHELRHYGFIVMTKPGNLGLNGAGRAAHWRLTELGYLKEHPTRDFERWDGTLFEPSQILGHTKTKPCPSHWDTPSQPLGHTPSQPLGQSSRTPSQPLGHTEPKTVPTAGT